MNYWAVDKKNLNDKEFVNGDKNFTLFARVTYPSIIKTSDRRLLFYWYLYV